MNRDFSGSRVEGTGSNEKGHVSEQQPLVCQHSLRWCEDLVAVILDWRQKD